MEWLEVMAARRSVRLYDAEREVEPAKLQRILEAAVAAPSAGNQQAYGIVAVTDEEGREALYEAAYRQEFLLQAPVVLVFVADPTRNAERYGERGEALYSVQDATIACTYAMLTAADLGLATVWVGAFQEQGVADVVRVAAPRRPVAMLPIGYAAEEPPVRGRRPLGEVVHEERW